MIWLLALTAIEALTIWLVSDSIYRVRATVAVNMILITLFAAKLVDVAGYTTNLGNALYAAAMMGQAIVLHRGHRELAIATAKMTLWVLAMVIALSTVITMAPVIPGNEAIALAIAEIGRHSPRAVDASFLAFTLSQATLILLWPHVRGSLPWRAFVAIAAAQTVDSVLFFPATFQLEPQLIEIGLVGFVVKLVLSAVLLPLLVLKRGPK